MNGEDVGGRKKGEVNNDGKNDDNDDNDDEDDDNNNVVTGGGRKRARFDPSRDTVLVVPDRRKLTNGDGHPTGEELLALIGGR